jgi:flagellar basal-body rod modification protein FlgD
MSVSAVSSTAATPATDASSSTAAASTQSLTYNDFLSLLMSELKNQDPTQPMDPSQMVSQLATVSQVGQSVQTNTTLSAMLTENSLAQAPLLVGQSISSTDGKTSGTVSSVNVTGSSSVATLSDGSTIDLSSGANVQ